MRSRRGLSHVHVGSLHAPDAEMALRNARDLYTRRQEGVSLWVVRGRRHRGVEPGRARRLLRPGGRQDLPAPDVLRRPRGGRAPVTDAASVDYMLALADDALVSAQRMGGGSAAAPQLEEDVALGQHRARPARPGPHAARATPARLEGAGRTEDDLAYLRDDREFRNVKLVERPRPTSAVAMARLLVVATYQSRAVRRACARSDRRDARRGRRQGGQGGRLPRRPRRPLGAAARRRHRRVPRPHAGGARRRVALRRGAVRRRSTRRWSRPGRRRPDGAAPAVRRRTSARARRGDAHRARVAARPSAAVVAACTPSTSATCSPRCSTCTARTPERRGEPPADPARRRRSRPRCPTPSCRC